MEEKEEQKHEHLIINTKALAGNCLKTIIKLKIYNPHVYVYVCYYK
jgi:hypothetical protein